MITEGPWKIIDRADEKNGGYIEIRGPNGEAICTIFPLAGRGGVGVEVARQNATFILETANGLLVDQPQEDGSG